MSESTGFQAATFTAHGTPRESVQLPGDPFDGVVHGAVMHQVVKAHLANQRQGTHKTKTRGFVIGGNQKPWRQKGTGRARQGSTRAPNWVGGGTVFGPIPRSYNQDIPRRVKSLARRSAFNARALSDSIFVIDAFSYDFPKTARVRALLQRIDLADRRVLLLTNGVKRNVYLSARNLPNVRVMPYDSASTYDVLWSEFVLIEAQAIGHELAPVPEKEGGAPVKRARKTARKAGAAESAPSKPRGAVRKKAPARKAAAAKAPAKKAAAMKTAGRGGVAKKTSARKSSGKTRGKEK